MDNSKFSTYNMNQNKSYAILNSQRSYKIIKLCPYKDFLEERGLNLFDLVIQFNIKQIEPLDNTNLIFLLSEEKPNKILIYNDKTLKVDVELSFNNNFINIIRFKLSKNKIVINTENGLFFTEFPKIIDSDTLEVSLIANNILNLSMASNSTFDIIAYVNKENKLHLYNLCSNENYIGNKKSLLIEKAHKKNIKMLLFNTDGSLLITKSTENKYLRIWRTETGEKLNQLLLFNKNVKDVQINSNNTFLICTYFDNQISLFEIKSKKSIFDRVLKSKFPATHSIQLKTDYKILLIYFVKENEICCTIFYNFYMLVNKV